MLLSISLVLKLWKGERRNCYEIHAGLIGIALAQSLLLALTMIRSTCFTATAESFIILMALVILIKQSDKEICIKSLMTSMLNL